MKPGVDQPPAEVGDERRDARDLVHDDDAGPEPPRYTGRVTPSKVNVVSVNPSSASAMRARLEAGELVAQGAEAHAAEIERVAVELLQVERRRRGAAARRRGLRATPVRRPCS